MQCNVGEVFRPDRVRAISTYGVLRQGVFLCDVSDWFAICTTIVLLWDSLFHETRCQFRLVGQRAG